MYLTHCLLNEGLVLFSFLQWTLFHFILHTFGWAVFSCQHTTVQQTTVLKASQLTQRFLFTPEESFRNHGCAGGWMTAYTKEHKCTSRSFAELGQSWSGFKLPRYLNYPGEETSGNGAWSSAPLLAPMLTKDWERSYFPILSFLCCHISCWARLWGKNSVKLIGNKFAVALYLQSLLFVAAVVKIGYVARRKERVSFQLLENQVGSSCSRHCSNPDLSGGSVFFF